MPVLECVVCVCVCLLCVFMSIACAHLWVHNGSVLL